MASRATSCQGVAGDLRRNDGVAARAGGQRVLGPPGGDSGSRDARRWATLSAMRTDPTSRVTEAPPEFRGFGHLMPYRVQEILLVEGQARPFWPEVPGTQAATYRQSAQQAERNGRGLWAACATEGASS